ncbi:MAG: response regulator [Myxococcales bacterium]|jgi:CheY-like chemotaxis protein
MLRVFVVDDEEPLRRSLVRVLGRPGFEVQAYGCSEDALNSLDLEPQLIVCDYHLPRIDGIAMLRAARERCPKAKTLLLSGGVCDDAITAAIEEGVVDRFFIKPWRLDALLAAVDELCGR